jgi:hypothetical protein
VRCVHRAILAGTRSSRCSSIPFARGPYQGLDGRMRRIRPFTMVLSWSRILYLEFTCLVDTPTFMRCHLHAFEYFGGIPRRCGTNVSWTLRCGSGWTSGSAAGICAQAEAAAAPAKA